MSRELGQKGNNKDRVSKTLGTKILDLEAHLYLLRKHMDGLRESRSHIKSIAGELRLLLCRSSGAEGLLYRLVEELSVNDSVNLHVPGELDPDHPLTKGLQFMLVPIWRGGQGPKPKEIPAHDYSFLKIIRYAQALVASGKPMTHEYLIKAIAQQMGSAHEDEGLEPALAQLNEIFINGVEPFFDVLILDAKLTLEVGERVLLEAKKRGLPWRSFHGNDYGNVTIGFRISIKQLPSNRVLLCRFHAYSSSVTIKCFVTAAGVEFLLEKNHTTIAEIPVPYPDDFQFGNHMVFALSYCSRKNQARTITAQGVSNPFHCQLGWVHVADLDYFIEQNDEGIEGVLFGDGRLLDPAYIAGLQAQSPYGNLEERGESEGESPFPT